eukprot:5715286-Pyramimonas_sp.AAC.1
MADLLCPLFMKVTVQGAEPISWQGGWAVPVPKKHPPCFFKNYRAILLGEVVAKHHHSFLRALVAKVVKDFAGPNIMGGLPGRGADLASLATRTALELLKAQGKRLFFPNHPVVLGPRFEETVPSVPPPSSRCPLPPPCLCPPH